MKKIVPFKKDILFKTDIEEITNISLEHTLEKEEDTLIGGDFTVSGDYKVTENTSSLESFSYTLPFEINLDEKYELKNAVIDIDDFYYEIINNKVLSISIDVLIDQLEEKEVEIIEEVEDLEKEERKIDVEESKPVEKKENEVREENVEKERCIDLEETPVINSFNSNEEIYKSYKVYIVREGDTLDMIMEKYGVTKSDIEDYNDLSTFCINQKIVIPYCNETNS